MHLACIFEAFCFMDSGYRINYYKESVILRYKQVNRSKKTSQWHLKIVGFKELANVL